MGRGKVGLFEIVLISDYMISSHARIDAFDTKAGYLLLLVRLWLLSITHSKVLHLHVQYHYNIL